MVRETNAQSTINGGMLVDRYFQFDAFEFFRIIIKIKEPYKNFIMSSNPCTCRKVGNKQNSNEHACTNVVQTGWRPFRLSEPSFSLECKEPHKPSWSSRSRCNALRKIGLKKLWFSYHEKRKFSQFTRFQFCVFFGHQN